MHANSFPRICQRGLPLLLFLAALTPPASAYRLGTNWSMDGSMSMNYRGLGNAREVEIENQLALTNVYFGVEGPSLHGIPMRLQFALDDAGKPELHQAVVGYKKWRQWSIEAGKFIVPFGRYNQLYRPGDYLTVTHPMLYADPRNLDDVNRINLPRPVFSQGYTDIGLHVVHFPRSGLQWMPDKVHAFVVNGLGESAQRGQDAPDPRLLAIPPDSPNGVDIDFEHRAQRLRDNNDGKTGGARLEFDVGDFEVPLSLPEGRGEIRGLQLGLSAMAGQYDVRDSLGYRMLGADAAFQYRDFAFAGEIVHSVNGLRVPVVLSSTTVTSGGQPTGPPSLTAELPETTEIHWGYYVQASFPIAGRAFLRKLKAKGRVLGVLGYNFMQRRGWELENRNAADTTTGRFILNGVEFFQFNTPPGCVNSPGCRGRTVVSNVQKYTAAVNYQMTDFFGLKFEYSYWDLATQRDLDQTAVAGVLQF